VKGRREVWAGGLKVSSKSFSVKQTRKIKDGDDGSSVRLLEERVSQVRLSQLIQLSL